MDQSFQNPSKRSERSSVYRTVCMMLRWPRKCCSARVSTPSLANLKPQACRSMCGCTGNGSLANSPGGGALWEDRGAGPGPAAWGVEEVGVWRVPPPQLAQGPDFLAGEGVRAIDTVLGPPHMDATAIKLDHIPGQFAEFAGP